MRDDDYLGVSAENPSQQAGSQGRLHSAMSGSSLTNSPPLPAPPLVPPQPPRHQQTPPPVAPPPHWGAVERSTQKDRWRQAVLLLMGLMIGAGLAGAVYRFTQVSWHPAVAPYVAYVEEARGYEFDRPVDVRFADVSDALAQDFDSTSTEAEDFFSPWTEAYRVFGLYEPVESLAASTGETQSANSAAFYDPNTREIVLPPGEIDLLMAETIVHELTHALQHQAGLLRYPFETADSTTMRRALVEGDADRIALGWVANLSEADQVTYWALAEAQREDFSGADDYLSASFYVPYALGDPTVELVLNTGGVEELDSLLRAKTLGSTEQLVDPLSSTARPNLAMYQLLINLPDGLEEPDGDLGPVTWFQILAPRVGAAPALQAVVGYDNDAFAVDTPEEENADDPSCVVFAVAFDSIGDANEFESVAQDAGLSVTAAVGDQPVVRGQQCESIGDPGVQTIGVLAPLMWFSYLTQHNHVTLGQDAETSRCAAMAQAAEIPMDFEAAPLWEDVIAESQTFLDRC